MKALFITLLSLIILTTLCFGKTKTEVVKDDRNLSGFNSIQTSSSINIILIQGDRESVFVETNIKFQKQVLTSVEGGVLKIEVNGIEVKPSVINVHVTLKELKEISYSGSGNICFVGIYAFPVVNFNINGSGNLTLKLNLDSISIIVNHSININQKVDINELTNNFCGVVDLYDKKLKSKLFNANEHCYGEIVINLIEKINTLNIGSSDLKTISDNCAKSLKQIAQKIFSNCDYLEYRELSIL